jgi:hypothetical protein
MAPMSKGRNIVSFVEKPRSSGPPFRVASDAQAALEADLKDYQD